MPEHMCKQAERDNIFCKERNYSISTTTNDMYIPNVFVVCNYNPAHVAPIWISFSALNCLYLQSQVVQNVFLPQHAVVFLPLVSYLPSGNT